MFPRLKNKLLRFGCAIILSFFVLDYFGAFTHMLEESFENNFQYPYIGNVCEFCYELRHNRKPDIEPINNRTFSYRHNEKGKCNESNLTTHLMIVVKSRIDHFDRRRAIRNSWGLEQRFPNILIRTVFSLGIDKKTHEGQWTDLQNLVDLEAKTFQDIIQFNFIDDYFNNTLKTVSGLRWCKENCIQSNFFLFVDDDFYVSIKNILVYLQDSSQYHNKESPTFPGDILDLNTKPPLDVKLFAGFVFKTWPLRRKSSKWFVSLEEYKYDQWPPYVTAGAFILSREALQDIYCVSLYTKHFRFDDIFLGIVAQKAGIELVHSDDFHFYKKPYHGSESYRHVLASHGYDNSDEMLRIWKETSERGFA